MLERAAENWLINTNERNYQAAFWQLLLNKGETILYVSPHGHFEQGKDIVTINTSGGYCAYQLITGNVDLAKWRKYKPEVDELIQLPINHPSVDSKRGHKSFIVTNGEITDDVRMMITTINKDNIDKGRKYSYLDVVNGKSILADIISAQQIILPGDLKDINKILTFYLLSGRDFLDKKNFSGLLSELFYSKKDKPSDYKNSISASLVVVSYMLFPFQKENNYYALFEAWMIVALSIIRYAHKHKLNKDMWEGSYSIARFEALKCLEELKMDVLSREDFLEGNLVGDGDMIYRARTTIVLGAICAHEIYCKSNNNGYALNVDIMSRVKDNIGILWFWGESAFPFYLNIIQYLELINEPDLSQALMNNVLLGVLNKNSSNSKEAFAAPYYESIDILSSIYGVQEETLDFSSFSGSSYIMDSLIEMFARRGHKQLIGENWRAISHLYFKKFSPKYIEDVFLWRIEDGDNITEIPNETQSWRELVKKANDVKGSHEILIKFNDLMRFFAMVYPHRANSDIIKCFDTIKGAE